MVLSPVKRVLGSVSEMFSSVADLRMKKRKLRDDHTEDDGDEASANKKLRLTEVSAASNMRAGCAQCAAGLPGHISHLLMAEKS